MNSHLFSSSSFLSLVCFLLVVFVKIQSSSSNPYNMYESCKIQFQCGNITAGYPFWGESPQGLPRWEGCGHPELKLNCEHNGDVPTMTINEVKYRVLDIKLKDETLRIARMDYLEPEGICSPAFPNTTINSELFDYSYGPYENVTFLYDCPPSPLQDFPCINSKGTVKYNNWSMKARDDDRGSMCAASVFFPVPKNSLNWKEIINNHWLLRQVLDKGFELKWKLRGISCENCINSKGSCGSDPVSNETICFCPNQPFGSTYACPPDEGNNIVINVVQKSSSYWQNSEQTSRIVLQDLKNNFEPKRVKIIKCVYFWDLLGFGSYSRMNRMLTKQDSIDVELPGDVGYVWKLD